MSLLPLRLLLGVAALALLSCQPAVPAAPSSKAGPAERTEAPAPEVGLLAAGEPPTALPVEADDAVLGSATARVTVVAFLDFECPYCRQGFAALGELRARYDDEQVRVVWKHLPLDFHPLALPAAIAGQAVRDVAGSAAFFEFAGRAFAGQAELGYGELATWAEDAGVPRELYNEAVADETTLRRVAADANLAARSGVEGTPAFFINGRALAGAQPVERLAAVIDEELAAMPAGSPETWRGRYARRVAENRSASLAEQLLARDPDTYLVPVDGSASVGPRDAPVTVVLFSDYECPYCARAEATVRELLRRHPTEVRLVWKHLPLPFHERALPAARLAEAVRAARGDAAFFAVTEQLFALGGALDRPALERLGREQGLEGAALERALDGADPRVEAQLEDDAGLAADVEAEGTPHFFVNGRRLTGARPLEQLEAVVADAARRSAALRAEGVPAERVYEELQRGAVSPGAPKRAPFVPPVGASPTRGPAGAPVKVHVFSDYECPFCRRAEQTLAELERRHPGELLIVWHDLPLPFHERARPAARAAREALARRGASGFWAVHDALFGVAADAARLSDEDLRAHARALGLEAESLVAASTSTRHDAALDADAALAESLGISGTPTFLVGDYLIEGAVPLRYFERALSLARGAQAPR